MEPTPRLVIQEGEERTREAMTDIHEKELADQIDREVSRSNGLLLLVLCLAVIAVIAVAGVSALLSGVLTPAV